MPLEMDSTCLQEEQVENRRGTGEGGRASACRRHRHRASAQARPRMPPQRRPSRSHTSAPSPHPTTTAPPTHPGRVVFVGKQAGLGVYGEPGAQRLLLAVHHVGGAVHLAGWGVREGPRVSRAGVERVVPMYQGLLAVHHERRRSRTAGRMGDAAAGWAKSRRADGAPPACTVPHKLRPLLETLQPQLADCPPIRRAQADLQTPSTMTAVLYTSSAITCTSRPPSLSLRTTTSTWVSPRCRRRDWGPRRTALTLYLTPAGRRGGSGRRCTGVQQTTGHMCRAAHRRAAQRSEPPQRTPTGPGWHSNPTPQPPAWPGAFTHHQPQTLLAA